MSSIPEIPLRALILTKDQVIARQKLRQFLLGSSHLFCLTGCAGTGKTTLIGLLAEELGHDKLVVCAPTNKAVNALRKRGFPHATTLDKVLRRKKYVPTFRPMTAQEIEYYTEAGLPLKETMEEEGYESIDNCEPGLTVVLDESSMVPKADLDSLMALFPKVVAIGDGFQLGPVDGEAWFQTYQHDAKLGEIVRTAAKSEITRLAGLVREKDISWRKQNWSNEVTLVHDWRRTQASVEQGYTAIQRADLVLAFANKTCDAFNVTIRQLRELEAQSDPVMPVVGDWLLAWHVAKKERIYKSERYQVLGASPRPGGYLVRLMGDEGLSEVTANRASLMTQQTDIRVEGMLNFSYGHCITTHKSQGGEWPRVVVIASDKPRTGKHGADYWNWLYTALTRAQTDLTILL